MIDHVLIKNRNVGTGHPVYIVAEMSANHNQDFSQAVKILEKAKAAGADAVKLQTYTPDTITIDCRNDYFTVKSMIWEGRNLYDLYGEAYTPWDWQPKLKEIADGLGLDLFATPFDPTSVEFLEGMDVPAYKIASFELVDLPLIRRVAQTGKPIILSTGMGTLEEIHEAVRTMREAGNDQFALLKCTSAYPASPEEINLLTIPHLAGSFGVPAGLSDHTLGIAIPIAAVALGACIIEKHFTLSRSIPGPDSTFSLEPNEFKTMVDNIREAEKALGKVNYEIAEREAASRVFRRSLFVVEDIKTGEILSPDNVRSIRPGYGLPPKYLDKVLGRSVVLDIQKGTPLRWEHLQRGKHDRHYRLRGR